MSNKSMFRKLLNRPVKAKPRPEGEINKEYSDLLVKIGEATIANKGSEISIRNGVQRVSELSAEMQERKKLDEAEKKSAPVESVTPEVPNVS